MQGLLAGLLFTNALRTERDAREARPGHRRPAAVAAARPKKSSVRSVTRRRYNDSLELPSHHRIA
jgi:hypothetical protein